MCLILNFCFSVGNVHQDYYHYWVFLSPILKNTKHDVAQDRHMHEDIYILHLTQSLTINHQV